MVPCFKILGAIDNVWTSLIAGNQPSEVARGRQISHQSPRALPRSQLTSILERKTQQIDSSSLRF